MNIRKFLNTDNWNIGFVQISSKELITNEHKLNVKWLKHNYRDRFFADPFILDVNDDYIYILAEELIFGNKGTIVKLTVDKKSFKLVKRKEILKLYTHLSYPLIVKRNHKIFVYPENSESGHWSEYLFDSKEEKLTSTGKVMSSEPLTDATPFSFNGIEYLISTRQPKTQEDAYLYKLDDVDGKYKLANVNPIIRGNDHARMGGNFFNVNGKIYRPAQDCSKRYGGALKIFEVSNVEPLEEKEVLMLKPCSWKYNLGIHTINFDDNDNLAVIDSYGYLYPIIGRIMMYLYKLKHTI